MNSFKYIILFIFLSTTIATAGRKDFEKYIQNYQYLAIREMERTGVPASIKLAQGLLESNAGKSTLARKAKNHFGIKCGRFWKGKKYYRKDDDYKNGKLVKSCFRKYRSPEESFLAHSVFLQENKRYHSLFGLNPTDYKKWAKGLKKAGYATSGNYDKKLIKLIEEYKLFRYDGMASSELASRPKLSTNRFKEINFINDAKMVFARSGETPIALARRTKVSVKRILAYNEKIRSRDQFLLGDEIVFLQRKRKNYRGKQKYHKMEIGENMYNISQKYGLCLSMLYKKNKMEEGVEPATGELVRIRGKAKKRPVLKTDIPPAPIKISEVLPEEKELPPEPEPIFPEIVQSELPDSIMIENNFGRTDEDVIKEPKRESDPVVNQSIGVPLYHVIEKGETLWGISQKYGLTLAKLMEMNGLTSKIISVGAKLRVK